MMKVTLDHEGCIGCGLCVSTCPAVFGLAADGKAEVVQTPISEEEKDGARLSAGAALILSGNAVHTMLDLHSFRKTNTSNGVEKLRPALEEADAVTTPFHFVPSAL